MRPAILVESYEDDESVSHHVDDLDGQKRIKSALAHTGTRVLLKMLLVTTLFMPTCILEMSLFG